MMGIKKKIEVRRKCPYCKKVILFNWHKDMIWSIDRILPFRKQWKKKRKARDDDGK